MIKEIIKVKLTTEFKKQAMDKLDETIENVLEKRNAKLTPQEKRKIKNLSLDQVNVNVSQRSKCKTMWVFDTENYIPVPVKVESKLKSIEECLKTNPNANYFKIQSNLTWTFKKSNSKNMGVTKEEFENEVLKILIEDFETAAFYGVLSYVN